MNLRIAKKVLSGKFSKKFRKKMNKLYPPFQLSNGDNLYPSWHKYHRIAKANQRINKYTKHGNLPW